MAKRIIETLVDDLDGTDLGSRGETIAFGLDGRRYEIDLSPENAAKLRRDLGRYVDRARKVKRVTRQRRRA